MKLVKIRSHSFLYFRQIESLLEVSVTLSSLKQRAVHMKNVSLTMKDLPQDRFKFSRCASNHVQAYYS